MRDRRPRRGQRGGTQVLFLICCPVLLGCVALCVDVGSIYIARQQLQNAVDASAKAGGVELPKQKAAKAESTDCAQQNGLDTSAEHFTLRVMNAKGKEVDADDEKNARQLEVKAVKDVPMSFAQIFGISSWPVGARALVAMDSEPVNIITNTTPFVVDKDVYIAKSDVSIVVLPCLPEGDKQEIWVSPGNLLPNDVEKLMVEGNPQPLVVGQDLTVTPVVKSFADAMREGFMKLASKADDIDPEGTSSTNPRIVQVPLVKKLNGGPDGTDTTKVEVVGFASFYMMDMKYSEVTGRFVDTGSTDGQIDPSKQPSEGKQKGIIRPVRLIE